MNLGLRYELPVVGTERYNRRAWLDLAAASPISGRVPEFPDLRGGLVYASPEKRRPYDNDTNNWGPRIGFAYQALPKLVLRGGYGIYYGLQGAQMSAGMALGYTIGTSWSPTLDSGLTRYATLSDPFPDGYNLPFGNTLGLATALGQNVSGTIRDWNVNPYFQQWSFSIQRELPANAVVEAAYSGSRGVHLGAGGNENLNQIAPQYHSLGTDLNTMVANPFYGVITDPISTLSKATVQRSQLLRPYPHFTSVSGLPAPPVANSYYHALQLKYTKRYSHGLSVSSHYTFSKLIDDNSLNSTTASYMGGTTSIQSWWDLSLERAVSLNDVTHRAVVDFTYELPVGRGRKLGTNWNRWVDGVLGGWQFNGIAVLQSGFPLVPALSSGILPDASQRPNLLSDPGKSGPIQGRLTQYLDPNAFSRPAAYTLGNAPRTLSTVRAPGSRGIDFSLFKHIYFDGERRRSLQIRAEAFNATNSPMFGAPNMTFGSTSFGLISSQANAPRDLQLALKLSF